MINVTLIIATNLKTKNDITKTIQEKNGDEAPPHPHCISQKK
jgi:hypothetical protein